ncbi:hypothetical protein QTP86_021970, partial [Hemibagrus guttatus]
VVLSNGYLWKNQRKFVLTHLRYFGEGKKTLELSIQQESIFLCDAFKAEQGPFDPQIYLNNAISNIISALVFGHRFEYHDENFQKVLRLDIEAVILAGLSRTQLYNAFPHLFNYLPGPHQKMFSNYAKIVEFLKEEIRKHKEDWDPSNPRDYIDSFLQEMEKRKSDPQAGFNIDTLVIAMLDLFEAGTESAATTIRWGLLFMMKYPEIQKKVQAEIDNMIGQSRQASMADKPNMPYTEAVIHEIQRVGNIVPLGFPKMATKDTVLGGFSIPKGTSVTTNLWSVLTDKNEWETPDRFNPGHFLDDHGQFLKKDAFLPFSAGKRACLGEQLARMELFLFFTSLLQSFTISPCPGEELSLEGQIGFTYAPKPYRMCLSEKYGNVFSLRRGLTKIVYVSGYKAVKEALVSESFARCVTPLFDDIYKGRGCPFDPLIKINNAVANVIGSLVFGQRYEYDDLQFQELLRMSAESVHLTGSVWNELYDAYPSIMKIVPGPHHTIIANYRRLAAFLGEKIEKHKQDQDSNELKDYIHSYLSEIENRRNDKEVQFNTENLEWCIVDLFEGGTETTTNTLRWALLYMIKYPLIQKKVQEEIECVIGKTRFPTMVDKANMPYTNAVLHEVQRKGDIVPLNMARVATKDTTLGGYSVPKGTVMITNISSVLNDEIEWETPDTFNPEHFLDSEGQFRRRDAFIPFSAGKRGCPGEYLARVELFLLFTCLLQKFTFSPPPGEEPSVESQLGFTKVPMPYKLCASLR